ncbi:MAG: HEAT repeat domain-containing protein [Planctomycetes bacterium]|nr:HEAT repeat domain-containing protein [Planctomycetota bacterium]
MVRFLWAAACVVVLARPAQGYVWVPFSLGDLVRMSKDIAVVEVEKVNKETGGIIFKKVADLKGKYPGDRIKQSLPGATLVLDWAVPGNQAVFLHDGIKRSHTCIGHYWYMCYQGAEDWWTLSRGEPEFTWSYFGPVDPLRKHVAAIAAGEEVVITAVQHQGYGRIATLETGLRAKRPPLWRIKASLKLSGCPTDVKDLRVVGIGAHGPEAVPQLIKALQGKDCRARMEAADDLGQVGLRSRAATTALQEALADPEPQVRIEAAGALLRVNPGNAGAVAALLRMLKEKNPGLRVEATEALGRGGAKSKEVIQALTPLVKDTEAGVRQSAASVLLRLGGTGEVVFPVLLEMLGDRDFMIRRDAVEQLVLVDDAAVKANAPALTRALTDHDLLVCVKAAEALQRLGPQAKETVPLLVTLLEKNQPRYPIFVVETLGRIGPGAKPAVPVLLFRLKNGDAGLRGRAAAALGAIGPGARDAIASLQEAQKDKEKYVRDQATAALKKIQP